MRLYFFVVLEVSGYWDDPTTFIGRSIPYASGEINLGDSESVNVEMERVGCNALDEGRTGTARIRVVSRE